MEHRWKRRKDAEQQPVRFLSGIWEQRTGMQMTSRELGQLRDLRKFLGDFTPVVVDWMTDSTNWWRFGLQVRAEAKLHSAPPHPHVGFLLKHRGRALRVMRLELRPSRSPADVHFCTALDRLRFEQLKSLVLVYSEGRTEWLAKIETASTLTALQQVFIALLDENAAVPAEAGV